jgi:RNA:NAD 2'-phosphotransferase (TPT1/KptA family)
MSAGDHLSPEQFFHGTSRAVANQIEKTGLSEGAHLTTNPEAARQYARYASGGSAWTKAKQGVVLAVSAKDEELREGSYGKDHHFVTGHSVTTTRLEPDRVKRA